MCVYFCFLTKTNRYLASFISHFFFSRSDFVLSCILDWQHKKYSSTVVFVCVVCVSWKHKEKWNHSSGGSGGSNWKIVNQALALACSCLSCMLAHLWLLLLLLFFVVVIVRIRTKRSRWNWSKRSTLVRVYFFVLFYWIAESIAIVVSLCCSGLMFYLRIEILCLPWNFRSRREFSVFPKSTTPKRSICFDFSYLLF